MSILPIERLDVEEKLSDEEVPVEILHKQVQKLTNKKVDSVKVLWMNNLVEGARWEAEADIVTFQKIICLMKSNYSLR